MITVNEITKKIEHLPKDQLVIVSEFVNFIRYRTNISRKDSEMNDYEILIAAERTGSFDFLHESSEDIYTLNDGEPL
jgi:hypothetical protein